MQDGHNCAFYGVVTMQWVYPIILVNPIVVSERHLVVAWLLVAVHWL